MKKVFIILAITILSLQTLASESKENLSHYIGAGAGFSTGYGLSYRYWPGDYGTQIVFTPFSDGETTIINLGSGIFKTLHETTYTRLFLFSAGSITYTNYLEDTTDYETFNEENPDESFPEDEITHERAQKLEGTVGIGPGLEIYIFKNIVLDIMFGFKYGISSLNPGLGFTGEIALYYRF